MFNKYGECGITIRFTTANVFKTKFVLPGRARNRVEKL